jgi:ubiquinone/menaquinone biosynthesis C-methylase UbiE
MTELPFENNSFDVILSVASFHHLNNERNRNKALQEMKRVLQPGGAVLLYVWSKNQPAKTKRTFENYGDVLVPWKSNDGKIYNRYYYIFQIEEIKELIEKNGFIIQKHIWDYGNEIFVLKI